MATIHKATLTPSKMELLKQWLPNQPWFIGNMPTDLVRIGSFRFDDPDGEVGIETLLVTNGSAIFQIPLTYRGSALEGADLCLIGTMEHSFLGKRWIYDAAGDPVYASALATTILTGLPQAEQSFEVEGKTHLIPESVRLQTTGIPDIEVPVINSVIPNNVGHVTTMSGADIEMTIIRVLNLVSRPPKQKILTASWGEHTTPVELAAVAQV